MPELTRQKITLAEMRASGVRGLLIYCSDYRCSHSTAISGDRWPDQVRLSDLEPRFTCQACGTHGADVRPDFNWDRKRSTSGKVAERGWKRPFEKRIPLGRGRRIVTRESGSGFTYAADINLNNGL